MWGGGASLASKVSGMSAFPERHRVFTMASGGQVPTFSSDSAHASLAREAKADGLGIEEHVGQGRPRNPQRTR